MSNAARNVVAGLRRQLGDRLGRLVDWRIDNDPSARLVEYQNRLDRQQRLLDQHRTADNDYRRRLERLEKRFGEVEKLQRWSANELERIIPQIAAQESQLESLRDKLVGVRAADQHEVEEARSLIDEIRREHAQVRVRLTGVAQYEDRLRKLEDRSDQS